MKKLSYCAALVLFSTSPGYADVVCNHFMDGRTQCYNPQSGEMVTRQELNTGTVILHHSEPTVPQPDWAVPKDKKWVFDE